jgi:sulfatase modifying factor 1
MRKPLIALGAAVVVVVSVLSLRPSDGLLFVEGGTLRNTTSNYYGKALTLQSFYMGRYEVTQKEWRDVMQTSPSQFRGDDLPVEMVSWYDCIEYCNRRSGKEGLEPYYEIDKDRKDPNNENQIDDVKWTVTINAGANGYRLPTEAEWEYAAGGGQQSANFTCSGSDNVGEVAWYWQNSGDEFLSGAWNWVTIERNHNRPQAVGSKAPNELGIYDMSGNVREWCWDWYGDLGSDGSAAQTSTSETGRVWKGGGWIGGDHCCKSSFRSSFEASGRGPDQGFRVCRDH